MSLLFPDGPFGMQNWLTWVKSKILPLFYYNAPSLGMRGWWGSHGAEAGKWVLFSGAAEAARSRDNVAGVVVGRMEYKG